VDWSWTGSLFTDAGIGGLRTLIVALGEGLVAGAISTVLALMFHRR